MQLAKRFLASGREGDWKNITSYLERFTKKDRELDDVNYQVTPREALRDYYSPTTPDAKYILQLRKRSHINNDELAIASFNIEDDDLTIHQLQVSNNLNCVNEREFLGDLKWERMLVSMIEDWAFTNQANSVRIRPAEKNTYWYNVGRVSADITLEQHRHNLKMRYDVTAKRSGFKYNGRLWVKHNERLAA